MAYEEAQNNYESPSDAPRTFTLQPSPIGYAVLLKVPGTEWSPAALTNTDAGRHLLARSCFTMFPTEADAEEEVRSLAGQPHVHGLEARICAVFPAGRAAPHGKPA